MTENEAKEWVTIKIPKQTRDNARQHDPTYGELLTYGIEAYTQGLVGSNDAGDVWLNIDQDDSDTGSGELVRELEKLRELVERVPERTADEIRSDFQ